MYFRYMLYPHCHWDLALEGQPSFSTSEKGASTPLEVPCGTQIGTSWNILVVACLELCIFSSHPPFGNQTSSNIGPYGGCRGPECNPEGFGCLCSRTALIWGSCNPPQTSDERCVRWLKEALLGDFSPSLLSSCF